jgi:hypothetical protein
MAIITEPPSEPRIYRLNISPTEQQKNWLEANKNRFDCATESKLLWIIVSDFIKKDEVNSNQETPVEDRPKTPQEERTLVWGKIQDLEVKHERQFECIRGFTPRESKMPENDSEQDDLVIKMWEEVLKHHGPIKDSKGRAIKIQKDDILVHYRVCVYLSL